MIRLTNTTKDGNPLPRWAERINTAMAETGVDVKQIAAFCKCNWRSVYVWRKGEHPPGSDNLKNLCKLLELDFDKMLELIRREKRSGTANKRNRKQDDR